MRSLLITIFFPITIIWGLTSGVHGIMVFNWITFMRPQDFAWSFWSTQPMFRYASGLLVISIIIHFKYIRPRFTPFLLIYFMFFSWMFISVFTSVSYKISMSYFQTYIMITPVLFFLITSCIHTLLDLKKVLWIMAGSIGIVSLKTSLSCLFSGNFHLSDTTNGFVGDNNTIALCVCLSTGMLMGLKEDLKKKITRILVTIVIIASVFLILVTQSRGAFLTLAIVTLIGIITSKKKIQYTIFVCLFVTFGYLILPNSMFNRLETLENVDNDNSAMNRVLMWKRAMYIGKIKPLTGVGVGCFRYFNSIDNPYGPNLVTHSVYFQILSNTGYPGLCLYLMMVFFSVFSLHTSYKKSLTLSEKSENYKWVRQTTFWMRNVLIGYIFGSSFLDMLIYDIPLYFLLYGSLFNDGIDLELYQFIEVDSSMSNKIAFENA